jgi:hypothetical protein
MTERCVKNMLKLYFVLKRRQLANGSWINFLLWQRFLAHSVVLVIFCRSVRRCTRSATIVVQCYVQNKLQIISIFDIREGPQKM